jgi:hypothetical protein
LDKHHDLVSVEKERQSDCSVSTADDSLIEAPTMQTA